MRVKASVAALATAAASALFGCKPRSPEEPLEAVLAVLSEEAEQVSLSEYVNRLAEVHPDSPTWWAHGFDVERSCGGEFGKIAARIRSPATVSGNQVHHDVTKQTWQVQVECDPLDDHGKTVGSFELSVDVESGNANLEGRLHSKKEKECNFDLKVAFENSGTITDLAGTLCGGEISRKSTLVGARIPMIATQ